MGKSTKLIATAVSMAICMLLFGCGTQRNSEAANGSNPSSSSSFEESSSNETLYLDTFNDVGGGVSYYIYDNEGNVTDEYEIDSRGTIMSWLSYNYDSQGNKVKEIEKEVKRYDPEDGEVELEETGGYTAYEYDSNGNKVREETYEVSSLGDTFEYTEYEYNNDDLLSKESTFDADGAVQSTTSYEYDSQGNETLRVDEDVANEITKTFTTTYKYDNQGRTISQETVYTVSGVKVLSAGGKMEDLDPTVHESFEFEYDDQGLLTEKQDNIADEFTKYEYDAAGQLILENVYSNSGQLKGSIEYQYDVQGNLLYTEDSTGEKTVDTSYTYNPLSDLQEFRVY